MESLDWHNRMIERILKSNPEATISDYLKLTDPYEPFDILEETVKMKNYRQLFSLTPTK